MTLAAVPTSWAERMDSKSVAPAHGGGLQPSLERQLMTRRFVPRPIWESWLPQIENLAVLSVQKGTKSIGITGAHDRAGTTTLSLMLARVFAEMGFRPLHVDLSRPVRNDEGIRLWAMPHDDPHRAIVSEAGKPAFLIADPQRSTRAQFHCSESLRECLKELRRGYEPVILDLAPLAERDQTSINPIAAAAACDAVIVVCSRGRTTKEQVGSSLGIGRAADLKIAGVVMNDVGPPKAAPR